jgi:hypothetical protein
MACFCIHSQMPNSIDWDRQRDRIQCRQIRGHGDCKSQSNDSVVWHGRWAARRQCLSREVGCPIASCMWVREGWEAILPYLPTTNEARELSDMTVWAARCLARGSNIAITILTGVLEPALELLDQLSPLGWNTVSDVMLESAAGSAIRICSDLVQIPCRQATSVRASMSRIASARGRSYACLATSLLPKRPARCVGRE